MQRRHQELNETVVPFTTEDGVGCNLLHIQASAASFKGPVILVHGAGVRANIFRAPVETNLVDYLAAAGYDVWLENWRGSIDIPPNQWTLDQVALYDHPAAVNKVIQETGSSKVKAVIHCQGSTSFMMSIVAGLLPQVQTVVSNAVSLHPIIPRLSRVKMWALIKFAGAGFPYLNPQWGLHSPTLRTKFVSAWVKLTHHECNNPVCKHASFTYGIGFPTLWEHNNLDDATHDWLTKEFATRIGDVDQKDLPSSEREVERRAIADEPSKIVTRHVQIDRACERCAEDRRIGGVGRRVAPSVAERRADRLITVFRGAVDENGQEARAGVRHDQIHPFRSHNVRADHLLRDGTGGELHVGGEGGSPQVAEDGDRVRSHV